MEFVARFTQTGVKEARADVAALRAEYQGAAGDLAKIGTSAAPKGGGGGAAPQGGGRGAGRKVDPFAAEQEKLYRGAAKSLQGMGASAIRGVYAKNAGDLAALKKTYSAAKAGGAGESEIKSLERQIRVAKAGTGASAAALTKAGEPLKEAAKKASAAGSAAGKGGLGKSIADGAANKLKSAAGLVGLAYGAKELGQLALGYRGMERLAGITARTQLNFRQLFSSIQPKPLLDTLERTSLLFSKQTVTGRALGNVLGRAFNGLFGAVNGAEPFIMGFIKGMVIGGLKLENVWLRARIALFPITSSIGRAGSAAAKFFGITQAGLGSFAGQVTLALAGTLGLYRALKLVTGAGAAVKGVLGLGGAAAGAGGSAAAGAAGAAGGAGAAAGGSALGSGAAFGVKAAGGLTAGGAAAVGGGLALGGAAFVLGARADYAKAAEKRAGNAAAAESILDKDRQAINAALRSQGIDVRMGAGLSRSQARAFGGDSASSDKRENAAVMSGAGSGLQLNAAQQAQLFAGLGASTRASGTSAGSALAAGLIAGMRAGEAGVSAAGASLGSAADKGVRGPKGIDAQSPAKKGIRSGRDLGRGVVIGMEQEAPAVEKAAAKALAPDIGGSVPAGGRGSSGRGRAVIKIGPFNFPNYLGDEAALEKAMDAIVRRAMDRYGLDIVIGLGIDPEGT